jgi:hypothetical protein
MEVWVNDYVNTCEGKDEVFINGRQGPVPSKKGQGHIDPFQISPDIPEKPICINA